MTTPTLSGVTPASGPTWGRYVVTLTGTGFRLAPQPPPAAYARGAEQQTVAVWVNGVRCARAYAASATQVLAEVPEWKGTPAGTLRANPVSVTVSNLNDAGAVIAGETATLAAGFAYALPNLTASTTLERVAVALIEALRRHVLPNTHWMRSRDYDADPSARADDPDRASVPRLDLVGPTLTETPDRGEGLPDPVATGTTTWSRPLRRKTYAVEWQIDAYCSDANPAEALALAAAVEDFFTNVPRIWIPADPAAPLGTQWGFEVDRPASGAPAFDVAPQGDGLRHFRVQFSVAAVDGGGVDALAAELGWTVYDADAPTVGHVPVD